MGCPPSSKRERIVAGAAERREGDASRGCPLAGLARDLRGEGDPLGAEVPRVFTVQHGWVRARFVDVGFSPGGAEAHARVLMSGHNGAILMAHARGNED